MDSAAWTFAKTYAKTWPHEYVFQTAANAAVIRALAQHIFDHGVEGRFYSQVRKYRHESRRFYWIISANPEAVSLVNRCDEAQTYEARLAAGALPR